MKYPVCTVFAAKIQLTVKLSLSIFFEKYYMANTEVWTLFPKFFTANILFWEYLGVMCFRPKNQRFCRKENQLHFPMNKGLTVTK